MHLPITATPSGIANLVCSCNFCERPFMGNSALVSMANLKLIGIGHIHLRLGRNPRTPGRNLSYHPIILKVMREIVLPQQRSLLPLYTLLQLIGQGPC